MLFMMATVGDCDSGEQLAVKDRVRKWATSMNFELATGSPMPTTKDFEYLCRGPMKNILLFIVGHVQPVKTVNKVWGNVLHKRQQQLRQSVSSSGSILASGSQPLGLNSTIDTGRSSAGEVKVIKEDGDKILSAEKKRKDLMESVQLTLEKHEILEALANKANIKVKSMVNQEKTLELFLKNFSLKSSQAKKAVFVQRDIDGTYPILETTCMKGVREACDNHADTITSAIVDDKFNFEEKQDRTMKEFRDAVRNILLEDCSIDVLRCLIEVSATRPAKEASATAKSSDELPFGLLTMQVFTKMISMETETRELREELDKVILKMDERLMEGTFDFAKKDIQESLSKAELKATSAVLQSQSTKLQADLQTWINRKKIFESEFSLVIDEENHMKKLQKVVSNLMKGLEKRHVAFDAHRRNVRETLEWTFHETKLESASRAMQLLHDRTSVEASAFLSNLPLHLMTLVRFQDTAQQRQHPTYTHELSLASHAVVQRLPDPCEALRMKAAARRTQIFLSLLDTVLEVISAESGLNTLTDLVKGLTETRKRKMEFLFPKIRDFADESTKLGVRSEAVTQSVRTWWEQPAQSIELGLKVDGTTLLELSTL